MKDGDPLSVLVYLILIMILAACLFMAGRELFQYEKARAEYRKLDELITEITSGRVHRGVTILNGAGAYSGKPEKILMCVIKRHQISEFRRLIRSIDPHSFCIVTDAKDVFGKGFENIAEVK